MLSRAGAGCDWGWVRADPIEPQIAQMLPCCRTSTGVGHIVGLADAPGTKLLGSRLVDRASKGGTCSNDGCVPRELDWWLSRPLPRIRVNPLHLNATSPTRCWYLTSTEHMRGHTPFDTFIGVPYDASMRMKRTYNLSPTAIATVKRLVEVDHLAATQDALVEQAIVELDRAVHDARDERLWSAAALDAEFQAELARIDVELPADAPARWE